MKGNSEWLARALKVVPGGAQTWRASYRQFAQGVSPLFIQRSRGCRIWDVEDREFLDLLMGYSSVILGHADSRVVQAASNAAQNGSHTALPSPTEVLLAERLCHLIPCAQMVRFTKTGSEANSLALGLAQTYTGRSRAALCGYLGWHDCLQAPCSKGLTHAFPYNDLASLEKILLRHEGEFAAIFMEPVRYETPEIGYLEGVRKLAAKHGALLIFDELGSGFQFGLGGAQKAFGVMPDLATFGKGLANGFPLACVLGKMEIMSALAKCDFDSGFAGETCALAAALEVLDILETSDAIERIQEAGAQILEGFNQASKSCDLYNRFRCVGFPGRQRIQTFDDQGNSGDIEMRLLRQETARRGLFVLGGHNLSAAHDIEAVAEVLAVYEDVFETLADWLSTPEPHKFLAQ